MQISCLEAQEKIFHGLHWSHRDVSLLRFHLGMSFLKYSTSQDKNYFPLENHHQAIQILREGFFPLPYGHTHTHKSDLDLGV